MFYLQVHIYNNRIFILYDDLLQEFVYFLTNIIYLFSVGVCIFEMYNETITPMLTLLLV